MGAFPTGAVGTTNLDAATDNPGSARPDLLLAVQRLNDILDSFADALGICDLDASGYVPAARLNNALKVSNNLSEVTAATASQDEFRVFGYRIVGRDSGDSGSGLDSLGRATPSRGDRDRRNPVRGRSDR
jgi:hypothetical protein